MIEIKDKKNCCGCSACSQICPKNCIEMKADSEGFLYPVVDKSECINCDRCVKVCPILNRQEMKNEVKQAYAVQNNNKKILKESTSGGFFTALAEWVIDNGGVVFGAAYDEKFYIHHTYVESKEDLARFRNSKYTQSDIAGTYKQCKEKLNEGKLVCFSGTPCQIEGLNSFLGKKYENLILVDVVCRGVPSPLLFEKYLDWNGGVEQIQDVKFRDKKYGYYSSTMSVYKRNGKVVRREKNSDPMLSFFFNDLCSRPSCYDCKFKKMDRVSDFTMFDCWHAIKYSKAFTKEGTTGVIARSEKAANIIELLIQSSLLGIIINIDEVIQDDGVMMLNSAAVNPRKAEFFEILRTQDFEALLQQFISKKSEVKNRIKLILRKVGLFNLLISKKMSR